MEVLASCANMQSKTIQLGLKSFMTEPPGQHHVASSFNWASAL